MVLRSDDLDAARFRMEYARAMMSDLRWLGLDWDEGPDLGGPHAPYEQSRRRPVYRRALERLHAAGLIYPCARTRRDVIEAAGAPHEGEAGEEAIFPAALRPPAGSPMPALGERIEVNWRLRVPDGEHLTFVDGRLGLRTAVAGRDFGDFPVWRKDDTPSYQLACTVDDAEMGITEVVRGDDLVRSTFRQLLVYRALGAAAPAFFHCPLMTDDQGVRLAKRHDALSLRTLRERGMSPDGILASFQNP